MTGLVGHDLNLQTLDKWWRPCPVLRKCKLEVQDKEVEDIGGFGNLTDLIKYYDLILIFTIYTFYRITKIEAYFGGLWIHVDSGLA